MGCGASGPHVEMTPEEKNGVATKACKEILLMSVGMGIDDAKKEETWDMDKFFIHCPKHDEMLGHLKDFNAQAEAKKEEVEKEKGGMAGKAAGLAVYGLIKLSDGIKGKLEGDITKKFTEDGQKYLKEKEFKKLYEKLIEEHKVKNSVKLCTMDPDNVLWQSVWTDFYNANTEAINSQEMKDIIEKSMNSGMFGGALPKAAKGLQDGWNALVEQAAKHDLTLAPIEFSIEQYMVDETVRMFNDKMEDVEKAIRKSLQGGRESMTPDLLKIQMKVKMMTKCINTVFSDRDHSMWKKVKGIDPIPLEPGEETPAATAAPAAPAEEKKEEASEEKKEEASAEEKKEAAEEKTEE